MEKQSLATLLSPSGLKIPVTPQHLTKKELALALDRKDQYNKIKMRHEPKGEG